MKLIFFLLLFLLLIQNALAQLSGKISDAKKNPVVSGSVALLHYPDSVFVKAALTDDSGHFTITQVRAGSYYLRVSTIGYQSWRSPVFELSTANQSKGFGTVALQAIPTHLNEVVIRAEKPQNSQVAGGISVNVQNSLLSKGSSALEVLGRSPGVVVEQQGAGISLNGKSGVMVMLDGKLIRLPMDQVITLLGSMSADDVEKIELLTTPPAKFDADGNAGLINIITRKNKRRGTNGSITATAGYGKGEKGSAAMSLEHRGKSIDLYTAYSFSHARSYSQLIASGTENVPVIGGQTSFEFDGIRRPVSDNQNARFSLDVHIDQNITIGAGINYLSGVNHSDNYNHGHYALKPDSILFFDSRISGLNHTQNLVHSIYLEDVTSKGEKLNFAADYIYYHSQGPTQVQNTFVDNYGHSAGAGDSLYAPRQRDLANTTIKVGVASVDYAKQFSAALKLETGLKGTYTRSYSQSGIENFVNGQYQSSSVGISNDLGTNEEIGAFYATINARLDKTTDLTVGGRFEYSHNGTVKASNDQYAIGRQLARLFPNILLDHRMSVDRDMQLSYSERISRPSYNDLASYVTYNDPISVLTGNPALKPTITSNLKLTYRYQDYLFSLLVSRDEQVILRTQIATGPSHGLVYLSPQNAPWQDNIVLQAVIPVKVTDWWTGTYSFIGGFHEYRIDFTPQPFQKSYFSYTFNFTESFRLPQKFSLEVSGYYNSVSYYSNSRIMGNGIVNLGMKKELGGQRGSLVFSVTDLFHGDDHQSNLGLLTKDAFDTHVLSRHTGESGFVPVFRLTYYRSLGSSGLKSRERREPASGEERSRI